MIFKAIFDQQIIFVSFSGFRFVHKSETVIVIYKIFPKKTNIVDKAPSACAVYPEISHVTSGAIYRVFAFCGIPLYIL